MPIVPPNFKGSTQLNPYITTYEDVIRRVKHTLGHPLVQIEISDEQVIDFVNESIEYFSKYAGYTEEFLVFDTKIYTPHTGLQVEKLINSTCTYGLQQSSVSVVSVMPDTYYLNDNNVYLSTYAPSQIDFGKSYQGDVFVETTGVHTPYSYIDNSNVVRGVESEYYINNESLFKSGSSVYDSTIFTLTGILIQSNIPDLEFEDVRAPDQYVNVVNVEPHTYYVYRSTLYRSGSSTNNILADTSAPGIVIQQHISVPTVSSVIGTVDMHVVLIPRDLYYIKRDNSLWRSSLESIDAYTSYEGTLIQKNVVSSSTFISTVNKIVDAVSAAEFTFYIFENQLYRSGRRITEENTVSYKGSLVNDLLFKVLPEEFVVDSVSVMGVPVEPRSVYFNASQNNALYRSGESLTLNNGYSHEGTLVQEFMYNLTPIKYTRTLEIDCVSDVEPHSYYLNGSDLWESGVGYSAQIVDAGKLISSGVFQDIEVQLAQIQCEIEVVNVSPGTFYLSGCDLVISQDICVDDSSNAYSEPGDVVITNVLNIPSYLVGTIEGLNMVCVRAQPNTFYTHNNSLYKSGASSSQPSYSYIGEVVQQTISNKDIELLTTVIDVVDTPPYTYYVHGVNVYKSGKSTSYYVANTSERGDLIIENIKINPVITQESIQCINMYYDVDMMSYRKVIDVFAFEQGESTGINTLFTLEQSMAQQIYSSYMIGNFGFDLVTWEVLKGFVETRNKVLAQKPHFRFDNRSQTLRIIPEPRTEESYLGLVGCYIERPIKDLIKERWVYDYTKALAMIAVGNVRGKYSGTGLFGGGQVNGGDIRAQGVTEKENLEKILLTEYRDNWPSNFFVG